MNNIFRLEALNKVALLMGYWALGALAVWVLLACGSLGFRVAGYVPAESPPSALYTHDQCLALRGEETAK